MRATLVPYTGQKRDLGYVVRTNGYEPNCSAAPEKKELPEVEKAELVFLSAKSRTHNQIFSKSRIAAAANLQVRTAVAYFTSSLNKVFAMLFTEQKLLSEYIEVAFECKETLLFHLR